MTAIESYLKKVVHELETDEPSKRDVYDELLDHLLMSKRSHIDAGLTEEEAERKAISEFGASRAIGKELQRTMFPGKLLLRICGWILFIPYILTVVIKTITGGINTYPDGTWVLQKWDRYSHFPHMFQYNLIPFRTLYTYWTQHEHYNFNIWFDNTFGNLFLFIPLGFLLPILFRSCRRKRTAASVSAAIGASIELIQCLGHTGVGDIDSVILRTAGAFIGIFLFAGTTSVIYKFRKLLSISTTG